MKSQRCVGVVVGLILAVTVSAAHADVFDMGGDNLSLEFVTVGNAGNTGPGAVDHNYRIGKYTVTCAQYSEFLNATGGTGYHSNMSGDYGGIQEAAGVYSPKSGWENRPVTYVQMPNAVRFVNWLHNGQGAGSTESGAYDSPTNRVRQEGARYWIPTANEWYKAAYHKNDGPTDNYWDYPTSTDTIDSSMAWYDRDFADWHPVDVDSYEDYASPYGTLNQAGNVREWIESGEGSWVASRRTGFQDEDTQLHRDQGPETYYGEWTLNLGQGLRVASVPEPSSITLLLCGALAGLLCWRRRRRNT